MSVARNHHYLPRFYLDRWAVNGVVFRYFGRLPDGRLRKKWLAPKALAYQRDLYRLDDVSDFAESQVLESGFFQQVDDRAADALHKLDAGRAGTVADRVALAQFMVSLLHRSPSRLAGLREALSRECAGAPYQHLSGQEYERSLRATAARLLATLVESADAASVVGRFSIHKMDVSGSKRRLMTSDRPITLSRQLVARDAFMILPYAPDRLVILAHQPEIVRAFSSQDPTTLVKGINRAVVEQSVDVVVASDERATAMVDRLYLRPKSDAVLDSIGLIRRRAPLIDLRPRVRVFSRHDKRGMHYLGAMSF